MHVISRRSERGHPQSPISRQLLPFALITAEQPVLLPLPIAGCMSHNSSARAPPSWHMYRLMLIQGASFNEVPLRQFYIRSGWDWLIKRKRWLEKSISAKYLDYWLGIWIEPVWLFVAHTHTHTHIQKMSIEFLPATFQSNDGSAKAKK